MRFNNFISKSIIATALLGTTFGVAFSGISASANNINNTSDSSNPVSSGRNNGESPRTNSSFQVNNNSLTLDSVPVLNFGNNSNNDTSRSGSNTLTLDNNTTGDDSRLLEVTDYRKDSSNNDWTLQASMDNVNDNGANNKQNINKDWQIDLMNNNSNPTNLDNQQNLANINNPTTLTNNGTNNGDQTIMNHDSTHSGYGVNQLRYDSDKSAKLTIPNVAPGNYSADINWKLSTNVSEENNNPA